MNTIDSIAGASSALSQAQARSEASMKVLKLAQGQGQAVANMVTEAMENLQETIVATAEGLGDSLDAYA